MRRTCHTRGTAVTITSIILVVSITANLYYIHTNNYNVHMVEQLQVSLARSDTKGLVQTTIAKDQTIPNGFVTDRPNHWKYFKQLFIDRPKSIEKEQFTIVMMTYQRPSLLRKLVPHYCNTGQYLNKFILIWNEVGGVIPRDILHHDCAVQFVIKQPTENKLTNRFYPYREIETDAIFTIDDDRLVLHEDLIFAFKSWQQYRHRVMGFEFRTHTLFPNGSYYYGAKTHNDEALGYSLLISADFLIHRAYLEMFNMPEFMNTSLLEYIDQNMNCEDLAMCTMVADFLATVSYPQTSCIGLKPKHYPFNMEAKSNSKYKGLSLRPTHVNGRTKCLNEFKKYYKDDILPLQYTNILFTHEPDSYYLPDNKYHSQY